MVRHAEYRGLYPLLSFVPLRVAHRIIGLRNPYVFLLPSERRLLQHNLKTGLPSYAQGRTIRSIALRHVRFLSHMRADALISVRRPLKEWHHHTRIEGLYHIEQAKADGRGVILLTCHSGYIYRALHGLPRVGIPMHVITVGAEKKNPTIWPGEEGTSLYATVLRQMKHEPCLTLVYKGGSYSTVSELLAHRKLVVTAFDNPARLEEKSERVVQLWFLSHYCTFSSTLLWLAEECGAVVLPLLVYSEGPDCTVRIHGPWHSSDRMLPTEEKTRKHAQYLFRLFESHILQYPEQWWLWKDLGAFRDLDQAKTWQADQTDHENAVTV